MCWRCGNDQYALMISDMLVAERQWLSHDYIDVFGFL